MTWAGYASTRLGVTLQDFLKSALHAFSQRKDAIVIQATGSGKSTCFHVPILMFQPSDYALVLVPTVALGNDHKRTFEELKINATFLTSGSSKGDYTNAIMRSTPGLHCPSVVIVTPETLFGDGVQKGIITQLAKDQLQLIAIDEAHLVFEWAEFRGAFKQIQTMRSAFECPIMALTATLKPSSLLEMKSTILRDPVIIKGSVDRRNVMINICPYQHSSEKKCGPTENVWSPVARQIQVIVQDKVTIVYCAYANECEDLTLNFLQLGLKSSSYTGKQTSSKDKKQIYESMKSGNIQILVATKAFGMRVNLLDIRFIFHIGIPENLSLWIQELGRAGRDGKPASAYLLVNERQDMKKLAFWIKNSTRTEAEVRIEDYKQSWLYISNAFTGDCLRKFHLNYFDDVGGELPLPPEECCIGCKIRETIPFKNSVEDIRSVLGAIKVLN